LCEQWAENEALRPAESVCNFNELEMICAGNWPPVAYEAPTPLYPSAQADAAVPTQQDTIKKGGTATPTDPCRPCGGFNLL